MLEEVIKEKIEIKKEDKEDEDASTDETNEDEEAADAEEKTDEDAEVEEEEKEYKEVIVPHTFTVEDFAVSFPGLRLLSNDQMKDAKKRIKDLEKRDSDKLMQDEAKNSYESQIYEVRAWLRDDDNEDYVTSEDREALLEKLEEAEDWLYGDGAQVSYTKYQERGYELTKEQTQFTKRKNEHLARQKQIPQLRESLEESRSKAHLIRDGMPWITE